MIISRLFGGLGNQLFQYATARAVAHAGGQPLLLDTRLAPPGDHWAYALNHFAIEARIAESSELPPDKSKPLAYAAWRLFGRSPRFRRENGLGFDQTLLDERGDRYLHGYFQSEKYFAHLEDKLRQELRITTPPDDLNAKWLDEISACTSVSIHLRRGDYISDAKSAYASCDAAYYQRALDHIGRQTKNDLTIFVFSNDPDWAKENLSFDHPTRFADHNGSDAPHEDMRLMSACTHNIIANSTFSWWSAWLNGNPEKIVVAPENWFATPKLTNPDIMPNSWVKV